MYCISLPLVASEGWHLSLISGTASTLLSIILTCKHTSKSKCVFKVFVLGCDATSQCNQCLMFKDNVVVSSSALEDETT
jgi:hypothetical protein